MLKIISILSFLYLTTTEGYMKFPSKLKADAEIQPSLFDENNFRLPNSTVPKSYQIKLTPNFESSTFDGQVIIDFELLNEVETLTLHSKELSFGKYNISLETSNGTYHEELEVEFVSEYDFVKIKKSDYHFENDNYTLQINFTGILDTHISGFWSKSYINDENEKVWFAGTNFLPNSARRAFPCFDEPRYKATFDIIINHEEKYKAISNMPVLNQTTETIVFMTTPLIPTHLVAFFISDFTNVSNNDDVTVHTRHSILNDSAFGLEAGTRMLEELGKFTEIEYKEYIPKMDLIGFPDFPSSTYSWGLVSHSEKTLTINDEVSSSNEKQRALWTIAHQMVHQWFGNLIIPKWWKYTWLNEGAATFFSYYLADEVEPKWRSMEQFVAKKIQVTAFGIDSTELSHPLHHITKNPTDIAETFDDISRLKGGAIFRMMQHFLTESIFKNGLQQYLKNNLNKFVDTSSLLNAFQKEAKKAKLNFNVKLIMKSWINQKGYPIINVVRNYDEKSLKITQERFITYNPGENNKKDKSKWYVPINYATEAKLDFDDTRAEKWLSDVSMTAFIDIDANHWLILNKQQTGFYRVNYDQENWNLIINYLNSPNRENIHVLNRAQLMNDALAFVEQERLNLLTLLHLTSYLKSESDYIAWLPGFRTFKWLNSKLVNTEFHSTFKEYVLNTTKHLIQSVGLEESKDDDHVTKLNRVEAVELACSLGDLSCTQIMQQKLTEWLNSTSSNSEKRLSPDLKNSILCHGLQKANFDVWNKTLTKLLKSKTEEERFEFSTALGCSTNKTILQYYLNYIFENDSPLLENAYTVIVNIFNKNDAAIDITMDFIIQNYAAVVEKIISKGDVASIFTRIGEKITTLAQLEKLKATKINIPRDITDDGIRAAEMNIEWLKNNHDTLVSWINELSTV